jgi:hypothetical protein
MKRKLRLPTLTAATLLLGGVFTAALGLWWGSTGGSASPTGTLTCSVRDTACVGDEVEVFRMSNVTNAHAGTAAGSGYGESVCCGEVCNLSTSCSDVHDTVVTLSADDNAHAAADGSYGTDVCLSVPYGEADCTYGPSCAAEYECVATVSGDNNAHVADCDGDADDYATKVCCRIVDDCDNDSTLDPDDLDDDGDQFTDVIEAYLPTDSCDACPDFTGTPGLCPGPTCDGDDVWPLDNNVDTYVTVVGDVLNYAGRIGATGGPPPSSNWMQRLDLNKDNFVTVVGDVLKFSGKIGASCT